MGHLSFTVDLEACNTRRNLGRGRRSICQCNKCQVCGFGPHTAIHGPALGAEPGSKPFGHEYTARARTDERYAMNIVYSFNAREGQTCENCGVALVATSYLVLGKGVNPGPYAAQNGTVCAECVLFEWARCLRSLVGTTPCKENGGMK